MRLIFAAALAVWASVLNAQDAEIQDVISRQIEAFQEDDVEAAYGFASPSIQNLIGSPARFGAMVRNGYPMVWRPSDFRFLELKELRGTYRQKVLFKDTHGVFHELEYQMLLIEDRWRINGVRYLQAAPAA
ncbi:DUF4864 domain-containing protein [Cognatishimia sp. 1_MG-2023]|uniref:DUF4864 domain-containing protein n=1 Tax=Cognatishimia sp. 1_MG-2023 TaxID=3062642 RepID=UPI0026E33669|nr:DUF4864 domain-containing protein [Cognatishimia sp. 1_MG-2023]MDO6725807.1 DUF4864 domain-containing protein [Cognatishimia sp. 1_MG-2023]